LVARVYAHPANLDQTFAAAQASLSAELPSGNRNPDHLTVLAMTGVTAMVRLTAEQMDRFGPAWPAEVVGPELAAADITAISNEVPFVPDCETNTGPDNLVFCSKPDYMEALTASGADIIGLTGNHQNDFGLEAALASLDIYAQAGLPVYGGGKDKEAAFKPLIVEHNGNRLAFLGANSYGPPSAWASDFKPGSAPFDLNIVSAQIREIKDKDEADLVLIELQYQESYDVEPLTDQRLDFRALARAGADLVTGVQSHVPQAVEFQDRKLILYGLGNLYFDQMWSEETRKGLIVKHTFYEGRHLSTQLLPTVLHDYGQPHWADPDQRAAILKSVFDASYWEK
jgi:poly-gamma-glutamate synthesis protein (capsule biosynthesis protein)